MSLDDISVVPLRSLGANSKPIEGNAVHMGYGFLITADHLFPAAEVGEILLPHGPKSSSWQEIYASLKHRDLLKSSDLGLLHLEGEPGVLPKTAQMTRLDRWRPLIARGWLLSEKGYQMREFAGKVVTGQSRPANLTVALVQMKLDDLPSGSLQGLSGGGVFNSEGQLVGIISHEDVSSHSLFFASLEAWPTLWKGEAPPIPFVDRLPAVWNQRNRLDLHEQVIGRKPILDAFEKALQEALGQWPRGATGEKSGFLVLLGGPKRGKSAVMAELIRRSDPASCPWFFAVRNQTSLGSAEDALARQVGYLLGRTEDAVPPVRQDRPPGTALGEMLQAWSSSGRGPLRLFIDALDELEGAERLSILPHPLPDGVFVVVSLRHEPNRRAEVTALRPCLGVINLDSGPDELTGVVRLLDEPSVQHDSQTVIRRFWAEWERGDRHTRLPKDLHDAIVARGADIVGYHVAYARLLAGDLMAGKPLPAPDQVPVPEDLDSTIWEHLLAGLSEEKKRAYRFVLGLIAAARTDLSKKVVQKLAGFQSQEELDAFLTRSYSAIRDINGSLTAHHIAWNDLVRTNLAGAVLGECHRTLANGSAEWPLPDVDHTYWLRYSPWHLMAVINDPEIVPSVREASRRDWANRMDRPDFLADRGALDGIDSLLVDLLAGVQRTAEMPPGDWQTAWKIFNRDSVFLRTVPRTSA